MKESYFHTSFGCSLTVHWSSVSLSIFFFVGTNVESCQISDESSERFRETETLHKRQGIALMMKMHTDLESSSSRSLSLGKDSPSLLTSPCSIC